MKKILLITALFFGLPVLLLSVSPELELSVGFADRFRSGTVTPVSLYIRNPDMALDADLILKFTAGTALSEGDRYTFRRSLSLSAGTPGVFRFSLPMEVSSYPLRARLEKNGLLLAEIEKELRPLNVDRPLVVGMSRRPSLDSLIPVLGSHFQRPVELVYPRSEFLPITPEAWEGASLVIWHDLSPEIPGPESLDALGLWIEGGGELIILGGPWLTGRRFPESLLPGTIQAPEIINGQLAYLPGSEIETTDYIVEFPKGMGKILFVTRDMVSTAVPEEERRIFWSGLFEQLIPPDPGNSEKLEIIINTIETTWFDNEQALLMPLQGPLLLVGLFSLAAGGILFAGQKISSSRLRALQLGLILVLSAGVSTAAVLAFLSSGSELSMTPRTLNLFVTGNYGSSRTFRHIRFSSPGFESVNWPLPEDGIAILPGGGDLTISNNSSGRLLEDLKLEPWVPKELLHETILPGNKSGDRADLKRRGVIRHNGQTVWYDVTLIDSGKVSHLISKWTPGDVLTIPDKASMNIVDLSVLPSGEFSRIVESLIPVSEEVGQIIMARGEGETVIVHLGSGI